MTGHKDGGGPKLVPQWITWRGHVWLANQLAADRQGLQNRHPQLLTLSTQLGNGTYLVYFIGLRIIV